MEAARKGRWIASDITGLYHYHLPSSESRTGLFYSKCAIHRINCYHYDTKRKFKLQNIPRPDKICKECLYRLKKQVNIFDYLVQIEDDIDAVDTILNKIDCEIFQKLPNIEVEIA